MQYSVFDTKIKLGKAGIWMQGLVQPTAQATNPLYSTATPNGKFFALARVLFWLWAMAFFALLGYGAQYGVQYGVHRLLQASVATLAACFALAPLIALVSS